MRTPSPAPPQADSVAARLLLGELREKMFGRREPIVIGRFELLRLLGRGEHGSVYLAEDAQLQRRPSRSLKDGPRPGQPASAPARDPQRPP